MGDGLVGQDRAGLLVDLQRGRALGAVDEEVVAHGGENYPLPVSPAESEDWKKRLKALGIGRKRGKKKEEDFLRKVKRGAPTFARWKAGAAAKTSPLYYSKKIFSEFSTETCAIKRRRARHRCARRFDHRLRRGEEPPGCGARRSRRGRDAHEAPARRARGPQVAGGAPVAGAVRALRRRRRPRRPARPDVDQGRVRRGRRA